MQGAVYCDLIHFHHHRCKVSPFCVSSHSYLRTFWFCLLRGSWRKSRLRLWWRGAESDRGSRDQRVRRWRQQGEQLGQYVSSGFSSQAGPGVYSGVVHVISPLVESASYHTVSWSLLLVLLTFIGSVGDGNEDSGTSLMFMFQDLSAFNKLRGLVLAAPLQMDPLFLFL